LLLWREILRFEPDFGRLPRGRNFAMTLDRGGRVSGKMKEVEHLADNTPKPVASERPAEEQPQAQMQQEIVLHDRDAHVAYSNFARVTATPEEVIIDFALNPNPLAGGRQEIQVSQRLIMNFYTAKRLYRAMAMALQRHEAAFGSIELDFRRRTQAPPAG
jgi:hypothetical protein